MTIIEFLEARIAEDEAAATRAAEVFPGSWDIEDRGHHAHVVCDGPNFHHVSELDQQQAPNAWLGGALQNVANFQPARVLAECAAKRAIIAEYDGLTFEQRKTFDAWEPYRSVMRNVLAQMAAVYKDHPDYEPEWARG